MRVLWLALAALAAIAVFFASIRWCHSYVVEEFDDADVPHIFKMGRQRKEPVKDDEFNHMADPDAARPSAEPAELNLNPMEGDIAMALYKRRPDIFTTISDWYDSDVAYDLEGLEKAINFGQTTAGLDTEIGLGEQTTGVDSLGQSTAGVDSLGQQTVGLDPNLLA